MLHLSSWMVTLPMMLIGMVGIILVIGIIVLSVMLLNLSLIHICPPVTAEYSPFSLFSDTP